MFCEHELSDDDVFCLKRRVEEKRNKRRKKKKKKIYKLHFSVSDTVNNFIELN